jgi:hypothetical protein
MKSIMGGASCIFAAVLILSGCGKDNGSQPQATSQSASAAPVAAAPALPSNPAPEPSAPPPPPSHNYAMVDNGTYGYEPALSENDVRDGKAAKALIMARYVGNKNGAYVIIVLGQDANDVGVTNRVSCQAPCEFAKSEMMSGDTVIKTETMRVKPDSLVGAMLEDAVSGQLIPYGQTTASQTMPTPAAQTVVMSTAAPVAAPPTDAMSTTQQQVQDANAPLQQTSFDCNQAGSIPQYLICHDPDLAASDRSLADLVQKARAAVQDQGAFSDRIRKQWNFREKNCKDKACLTSWYEYETDVLTKIAQSGQVSAQ